MKKLRRGDQGAINPGKAGLIEEGIQAYPA
jgi:hypothetical protein